MISLKKTLPILAIIVSIIVVSTILNFEDVDADGIFDKDDNCIDTPNPTQEDYDHDSFGNECDVDDDNDGFVDELDFFDMDVFEWADFDFDGIGQNSDPDDDNDGILDLDDDDPILPTEKIIHENLHAINDCIASTDISKTLCYSIFFEDLIHKGQSNLGTLDLALTLSKSSIVDDCHFISHSIGHATFENNPDVSSNLKNVDSTICRGGYYHGVLAAYFHQIKENETILPDLETICTDLIGSSDYQDCIHGLGHGMIHYYLNDVTPSVSSCHKMSFYHRSLCVGGVMMQYTDSKLTSKGLDKNNISGMCTNLNLDDLDYQQCNISLGLSLAYYTNHNLSTGSKICNLIDDEKGKSFCLLGLSEEIKNAKDYKISPITKETREIFQPQFLTNGKIIDIRSPAIISNFDFVPEIGLLTFSFDTPNYIILYVPDETLSKKSVILVNGLIPNDVVYQTNYFGQGITMIQISPKESGMVMIAPA